MRGLRHTGVVLSDCNDSDNDDYIEPEIKPPSNRKTAMNKMTINEMLLLDVGSEDEKIDYYKRQVEEIRLINPPPKIEVTPEDLDPSLRFKRMMSDSGDDMQSNFRSSVEVPRDNFHNDLQMFGEDEGAGYYQSYHHNDRDYLEGSGYIGSNPSAFNTIKSGDPRHVFSKPTSPGGVYVIGDRATTVHNESVYYDGGGVSAGTNTLRFNPGIFQASSNQDEFP